MRIQLWITSKDFDEVLKACVAAGFRQDTTWGEGGRGNDPRFPNQTVVVGEIDNRNFEAVNDLVTLIALR